MVPYVGLNMPPFCFLLWNYPQEEFMDLEVYHGMSRRYSELPAFPSRTERNCHSLPSKLRSGSRQLEAVSPHKCAQLQGSKPPNRSWKARTKVRRLLGLHHVTNKVALYSIKCTRGAEGWKITQQPQTSMLSHLLGGRMVTRVTVK